MSLGPQIWDSFESVMCSISSLFLNRPISKGYRVRSVPSRLYVELMCSIRIACNSSVPFLFHVNSSASSGGTNIPVLGGFEPGHPGHYLVSISILTILLRASRIAWGVAALRTYDHIPTASEDSSSASSLTKGIDPMVVHLGYLRGVTPPRRI